MRSYTIYGPDSTVTARMTKPNACQKKTQSRFGQQNNKPKTPQCSYLTPTAQSYLKSMHACPFVGSCYRPWFLLPRAGDAMAVPWTSGTSSSCRAAGLNKHKMMACPLAATRAAPDLHRTSANNSIIRRLTGKTRESAQSNNSRQTRTHYTKITEPPCRDAQPRNVCTFLRSSSRLNAHAS